MATEAAPVKLSIIVLTHNRLAALRECLIRLQSQTETSDAEIIVVDNGSTDGTFDWIEAWANTVHLPIPIAAIHLPDNKGVCERNHGILAARGDFIAQVDDDVLVMSGWDSVLMEPMLRDPAIGATGQEGLYQERSWQRTAWSAGLIDDRRKPADGQFCDFVTGYCWMWRNLQVREGFGVGSPRFLYDERFNPFWHEESDLQLQIRAAGYRILKTRQVANHRSLHDWQRTMADEGPTAKGIAERNFGLLKDKWQHDASIRYEGEAVGLR